MLLLLQLIICSSPLGILVLDLVIHILEVLQSCILLFVYCSRSGDLFLQLLFGFVNFPLLRVNHFLLLVALPLLLIHSLSYGTPLFLHSFRSIFRGGSLLRNARSNLSSLTLTRQEKTNYQGERGRRTLSRALAMEISWSVLSTYAQASWNSSFCFSYLYCSAFCIFSKYFR